MATLEENKRLVLETWEALRRGDVKAAFASMTDDVTWRIPGMIGPVSGLKRGKSEIIEFLRWAAKTFPPGMRTEVCGVYAEAGTVVLELVNRSTTAKGKPYENEYCFVFEVEGGKVRHVREYVDTQKVDAILSS